MSMQFGIAMFATAYATDPVTTLDQVSNGRLLCGVGGGWSREEMGNALSGASKDA